MTRIDLTVLGQVEMRDIGSNEKAPLVSRSGALPNKSEVSLGGNSRGGTCRPQMKRFNRIRRRQHRVKCLSVALRNDSNVVLCLIKRRNAIVLINIPLTSIISRKR
jgi:hypothetical protein